jgi:hypothetical protein
MCGAAPAGKARCFALSRTDIAAHRGAVPLDVPTGYPLDLASAYDPPAGPSQALQGRADRHDLRARP